MLRVWRWKTHTKIIQQRNSKLTFILRIIFMHLFFSRSVFFQIWGGIVVSDVSLRCSWDSFWSVLFSYCEIKMSIWKLIMHLILICMSFRRFLPHQKSRLQAKWKYNVVQRNIVDKPRKKMNEKEQKCCYFSKQRNGKRNVFRRNIVASEGSWRRWESFSKVWSKIMVR